MIFAAIVSSCGNSDQGKALAQAKAVQSAVKQNITGSVSTSAGGYTMKAKLDGKDWTANSMMPPQASGRIIGYNNGEYIGLPFDKSDMVAGKKISFGEGNAADLATNDDTGIWGGLKGEMEITKADESWA